MTKNLTPQELAQQVDTFQQQVYASSQQSQRSFQPQRGWVASAARSSVSSSRFGTLSSSAMHSSPPERSWRQSASNWGPKNNQSAQNSDERSSNFRSNNSATFVTKRSNMPQKPQTGQPKHSDRQNTAMFVS